MKSPASFLGQFVTRVAGRLRFPYLFLLTATLFVLDVLIPDFIPLADEIILGLSTLLFGLWRERKQERKEEPTPPASGEPPPP